MTIGGYMRRRDGFCMIAEEWETSTVLLGQHLRLLLFLDGISMVGFGRRELSLFASYELCSIEYYVIKRAVIAVGFNPSILLHKSIF